ncbi:23S rRNA (uracil(1939)-C(5))-methyltransferase RlmD [Cohnella sp. CIP 111063]|uniref:23S rRNA (uracil(1939)-C(5))-methyltransferase RlmD n=1 Tax=unclassified Cohnella TaxID=2636738 RepID=UPI000B8C24B7|nr:MULTISPECIES: 23S rRNA (uracil(1939)-C(5))-methyltransferase RlmD [unclassified Cohnella]OXS56935.1 23S rRNA (uracil(1939)-C(5))-methyltransferase RlmD [Cohnella sp. CIP 111063]PRX69778.1 23S rRNA (uracil1939-C5)-methyltransferase [Cohnella sp. SGD-V74]
MRSGGKGRFSGKDHSSKKRRDRDFNAKEHGAGNRSDRAGVARVAPSSLAGVPVRVGERVESDIVGLTHDGEGVGRVEGYTLFVRGALPGERVLAEVLSIGKSFGRAQMTELLDRGTGGRVEPPCPIHDSCGGCQLQHLDYQEQLKWKRQHVVDNLQRIGKLRVAGDHLDRSAVIVHPTIGMDEPWRYRNKAQVPIGHGEGGLIGGFYEMGSHDIVEMDSCLIQQEENEETVRAVKEAARMLGLSAYNRTTGRGLLRHVVVRHARTTGQRMVVLVTNGRDIPHAQELVGLIRERVPGIASICQNIQTAETPVVFGDETRTLWGEDVIYDEIDGIQFAISPRSFFQVNPEQTVRLYGKAVEYAALTGQETVIDAYCGIGTISLFLARHADRVFGVEIVPEAIEDARRNAAINGMNNVEFAVGASEVVMPRWQAEGITPDVIVVDPPRKGCDPVLIETMLELKPARIVYVSCNPSTLARDLLLLEDGGYRTVEVQPVDMFPHTVHVESVALLVRDGTDR